MEVYPPEAQNFHRGLADGQLSRGWSIALTVIYCLFFIALIFRRVYATERVKIYNYLIAGAFFRGFCFACRLATSYINYTWITIFFTIAYIFFPVTSFLIAQAGLEICYDWHDSVPHPASAPDYKRPPMRILGSIVRHIVLSIAMLVGMANVGTRAYVPIGWYTVVVWALTGVIIAVAGIMLRRMRMGIADGVTVQLGMVVVCILYAVCLAMHALFNAFLALGRRQSRDYWNSTPLLEWGVLVMLVLPDLLVFLPMLVLNFENMDRPRLITSKDKPEPEPEPEAEAEAPPADLGDAPSAEHGRFISFFGKRATSAV